MEIWDNAKEQFTGPDWEFSWADWEARRARVDEKLRQGLPGLKSPRDR